jgi:short-subunit dehydrogenase
MLKNGKGTILFTGATASLRGSAKFGGFAASKFALRALAQSMARELGPQGVHVAHVIVDGPINTPRQLQSKNLSFSFLQQKKQYFTIQVNRTKISIHSLVVMRYEQFFCLFQEEKIFFDFRLLKHIGICMFNLVQHGHKNLTFVHQWRNFKIDI